MRRTSLSLLILALLLGACSDDGPSVAKLEDMRVVKISGDQSSPVPPAPSATVYATAGASLALSPDGYTPEPLVARVEAVGARGMTSGGPVIPPGTLVHWQIPEEAGRLFGGTTATDDSAHVVNRWAPGTKAGTYRVTAGRLVDAEIVTDAEWELVVEPGPVHWVTLSSSSGEVSTTLRPGETFDARPLVIHARDRHGNRLDAEVVRALPDAAISWRWYQHEGGATERHGTGWVVTMPDPVTDGYRGVYNPPNRYSPGFTRFRAMFRLTINGGVESGAIEFAYSVPDS